MGVTEGIPDQTICFNSLHGIGYFAYFPHYAQFYLMPILYPSTIIGNCLHWYH